MTIDDAKALYDRVFQCFLPLSMHNNQSFLIVENNTLSGTRIATTVITEVSTKSRMNKNKDKNKDKDKAQDTLITEIIFFIVVLGVFYVLAKVFF